MSDRYVCGSLFEHVHFHREISDNPEQRLAQEIHSHKVSGREIAHTHVSIPVG